MNQHSAWIDEVSRWLIHSAARRAPDALSERLEEEWLADIAARGSGVSRLRFAIGCCWATRVIAYEYQPAIRVAGTVMAPKLAHAHLQFNVSRFSRRSTIAFLVVTLHVGLFYVLVSKLSHTHFNAPPPPFKVDVIDPTTPKLKPLPPVDVIVDRPVITIEVPVPVEIERNEDSIDKVEFNSEMQPEVDRSPPQQRAVPSEHVVQRTQGGPGARFPNAEDFYPDSSKRLGEQGIATVQVCVDPKGRLTSEPATLQGTGSARLDEGALKLARAASGHYRATTEDGQPVNSCYPFRIRFQLKN